jgi:four helix bundle protein
VTSDEKKTGGYKDLLVWQKAMLLVQEIYVLTRKFPADERFGLISQMRRAAVSVPSNIAEGQARHSTGEFVQFLSHAEGSLAELDTQVNIAINLGFCTLGEAESVLVLMFELRKMLNALRRRLQGK